MGESTCLMHAFSYASPTPYEAKEGNPIQALGESVSFGRFMSESLSWEKWSAFPHKKYVEEAAKYSKPGSVAQKKAFFEAYYKKKAMLEQAKAEANPAQEQKFEGIDQNIAAQNSQTRASESQMPDEYQQVKATHNNANVVSDVSGCNLQMLTSKSQVSGEQQEVKAPHNNANLVSDNSGCDAEILKDELVISKVEGGGMSTENPVAMENHRQIGHVDIHNEAAIEHIDYNNEAATEHVDNHNEAAKLELSEETEMEKPLLKDLRSKREDSESVSKKKPAISSLKPVVYSRQSSKIQSSPGRLKANINHPRKENATPTKINSAKDSLDRMKASPRPLHMYMNITPARDSNKLTSQAIWNNGISRFPTSSSKSSKDCKTPLKTPAASIAKKSAGTPLSENRRTTTPLGPSASGSRTTGNKWRSLAMDFSKSLSACRNKLRSPIISSPFNLRTEERAARRKEKLEEKFNEKVAQKVQIQTTFKEKAESELKRLRHSLCFKARPLPDFYKERKPPQKKNPLLPPQSPKLNRDLNVRTDQGKTSLPPQRLFAKSNSSKNILQKKNQSQIRPRSLADMISQENTSPNIVN